MEALLHCKGSQLKHNRKKIALLLISFLVLGSNLFSQIRILDYNSDDIESLFHFLDITFYKWRFDTIPKNYDFILFFDEYENDSLINSYREPINTYYLKNIKQNDLLLILKQSRDSVIHIKCEYIFFPVETKFTYSLNTKEGLFNWELFENGNIEFNKKVPLVLFGKSWKSKDNLSRFCWKYAPKRNMTNKEFSKISHKVIIGYIFKLNND